MASEFTHSLRIESRFRGIHVDKAVTSLVSFQGGITVPVYASAKGGVTQFTVATRSSEVMNCTLHVLDSVIFPPQSE